MSASDSRCSEDDKTTKTKTRRKELRSTIRHASTLFNSFHFWETGKLASAVFWVTELFFFVAKEALEPFFFEKDFVCVWLNRGMVMTTAIDCLCKIRNTGTGDGWRKCEDCMRVIASVR